MDDVIKLLKQLVSGLSEFGSVPKPVKVCIGLFSGVFGISLIFVYAHLDKRQTVMLVGAIVVMLLATGVYYAWKAFGKKKPDGGQDFWDAPSQSGAAPAPPAPVASFQPAPTPYLSRPQPRENLDRRAVPVEASNRAPRQPAIPAGKTLTLLQLIEPLFQYVCRLNRLARRGPLAKSGDTTSFIARAAAGANAPPVAAMLNDVVVRSEIKALLEDIQSKAAADLHLAQQAQKIDLPLVFFVDSMVAESKLPFASQWNQNRLAYDRQELAGDEKFFDLLDEALKEKGEDAAERLAVFYVCIGLGFTGIYFNQPDLLRKTMLGLAPRIRHLVENDPSARFCPEAYQGVDSRNLVQPPSSRMALAALLFASCTLAVMISYAFMYRQASANLNHSIEEVLQQELALDSPK
jgi:type IV/VI secretion system ImpK/VasF family protein